MEESEQKIAIEGMERVLPMLLLHHVQAVGEVVRITVESTWLLCIEEALPLDKVDEHQAVEHQRSIPLAISLRGDPLDEFQESGMFNFEALIEFLGDALYIEGLAHSSGNHSSVELLFLVDAEGECLQLLCQEFAGLAFMQSVIMWGKRLAGFTLHPLPYLVLPGRIHVDEDMLIGMFRHFTLNATEQMVSGNLALCIWVADIDLHA